jgi:hypothetical protein
VKKVGSGERREAARGARARAQRDAADSAADLNAIDD